MQRTSRHLAPFDARHEEEFEVKRHSTNGWARFSLSASLLYPVMMTFVVTLVLLDPKLLDLLIAGLVIPFAIVTSAYLGQRHARKWQHARSGVAIVALVLGYLYLTVDAMIALLIAIAVRASLLHL